MHAYILQLLMPKNYHSFLWLIKDRQKSVSKTLQIEQGLKAI